jgi:hypothetical protein
MSHVLAAGAAFKRSGTAWMRAALDPKRRAVGLRKGEGGPIRRPADPGQVAATYVFARYVVDRERG